VDEASGRILGKALDAPPAHEPGALPRWLHEMGVGVIIALGQIPKLFGLPKGTPVISGLISPELWRWQGLVVGLITIAVMVATPKITRKVPAAILGLLGGILTYFVLVGMFVALGLSVLSKEVLMVMATPPFYGAYKVIPLIALSYVLYGCYFVFNPGMLIAKKTKYAAPIVGAGAVMNLGLNYLLIPNYGMMGAAVATVISYLMLPIGLFVLSRRFYPIKYEWGRVAKIFGAAALVYLGSIFITSDSAIIAGLLKLCSLLGFPILLFAFRFFKPEEIQKAREVFRVVSRSIKMRLARKG